MQKLILWLIPFDVLLSSAEATILGFSRLLTTVVSSSLMAWFSLYFWIVVLFQNAWNLPIDPVM